MEQNWEDRLELGPDCYERFVDQQRVPTLKALNVAIAGISQLRGDYCVARKKPDYHTILFTLEGEGELHTHKGRTLIPANTLTLLPARHPFLITLSREHWATTWFCLEDTAHWSHLRQPDASVRYSSEAAALYYLLGHLYYENDPGMQTTPLSHLSHYLHNALGNNRQSDHLSEPERRLEQLFGDIQQQLHVNWTIERMAERVHYSPSHFHRLCQQQVNRSPIQQLIHLRMERAKQLLSDTHWSLNQIASAVGYSDVFNFSNRFKKSTGVSPSQFRASPGRRSSEQSTPPV
ncbi:helix-turn-helix transcriptional regulator [Teredinibacter turnerae]|uniref:helix-turn-helix transcriptional regulator n=1 Tax=Teredinibacter turnerae TaxID=2426 RepID=UPI000401FEB5|nr:helix-turn-helix transcriptional regulator [Teredinibacter turnerae]